MIDFTGLLEKASGLLGEANVAEILAEKDPSVLLEEAGIEGGAENSVVDRITELFEQSRS